MEGKRGRGGETRRKRRGVEERRERVEGEERERGGREREREREGGGIRVCERVKLTVRAINCRGSCMFKVQIVKTARPPTAYCTRLSWQPLIEPNEA